MIQTHSQLFAVCVLSLWATSSLPAPGAETAVAKPELTRQGKTISNGTLTITKSNVFGGAVVSYQFGGVEFLNIHDAGRLLQISCYGKQWKNFSSGGYAFDIKRRPVINPNEAGDARGNPSKILELEATQGLSIGSKCVPREWFTHSWPKMDDNNGAAYENGVIASRMTFVKGYNNCVSRLELIFTAPATAEWHHELPALYLEKQFTRFYGFDAQANTLSEAHDFPYKSFRYSPASKIGGVIATTAKDGVSIGIYGAAKSVGGSLSESYIGLFRSFQGADCSKLGNETYTSVLAKGSSTQYHTFIVAGQNPAAVQSTMLKMYRDGLR